MPYLIGGASLVFVFLFCGVFSGTWNPITILKQLSTGDDNSPSASRFQFVLWTAVAIFSFMTIWYARVQQGSYSALETMPANLLGLMGISAGSTIASKGIVSYQISHGTRALNKRGKEEKKKYARTLDFFKYIIVDDDGELSLSRLQMISWTFIAAVIYIVQITGQVGGVEPELPDVADSLLVLMGVSQGAYLGKKLVTASSPILQSISSSSAVADDTLTIKGKNFGDEQSGSTIKIIEYRQSEDKTSQLEVAFYASSIPTWGDKSIDFKVPPGLTKGAHNIAVVIGGKESNQLTLNVT